MVDIVMNARVLAKGGAGVHRYAAELAGRLRPRVQTIAPRRVSQGILGHAWEQFTLPRLADGRLLWSPATTGPVFVRNQVVTVHDIIPLDHPEWFSRRFSAWYGCLIPRLLRGVTAIIAISEHTKQRIVERVGVEESSIAVIYNGVGDRFRPQPAERIDAVLARNGIGTRNYLFGLCTVEPRKNLARLLEAWRRSSPRLPDDVWLVLGGSLGTSRVFGDAGIGALPPRVATIGRVADDDLPALYGGALAFVYPSLYEGFGLPPIEAMACGCAVLTSAVSSLPEVCGDAAFLIDPNDTDAIADGMIRLVLDDMLRERLKGKSLAQASRFTWDSCASETYSVLQAARDR